MDKEQFGRFVAEERKKHDMTQGQLAEKVHVSTAAVSKWERCLCLPDLTKLEDIAEALDLSLMELMQCKRNAADEPTYKVDDVQNVLHSTVRMSENELKRNKKKIFYLRAVLCIAAAAALLLGYFLFSRPMTLSQLYPMIKIDQCSEVKGYYEIGLQEHETEFCFGRSDEEFWKLLMLFNEQEYRRSLKDLLPDTTKTHMLEGDDDFRWDVGLRFDEFTMPDGSTSSGFLRFHNWYGDLEIYFDGEAYACFTAGQNIFDPVLDLLKSIE